MSEDWPQKTELDERQFLGLFTSVGNQFEDLEGKLKLYSDSEKFSVQELNRYLERGELSGDKRFESVAENHRRMYELLLDSLGAGIRFVQIFEIYREFFPDSCIVNAPEIMEKVNYVRRRYERLKSPLLDELCFRDRIMKDVRTKYP